MLELWCSFEHKSIRASNNDGSSILDFIALARTKTIALENGERETPPKQLEWSAGRGKESSGDFFSPPPLFLYFIKIYIPGTW